MSVHTVFLRIQPNPRKIGHPVEIFGDDDMLSGDDILPGFTLKIEDLLPEV